MEVRRHLMAQTVKNGRFCLLEASFGTGLHAVVQEQVLAVNLDAPPSFECHPITASNQTGAETLEQTPELVWGSSSRCNLGFLVLLFC